MLSPLSVTAVPISKVTCLNSRFHPGGQPSGTLMTKVYRTTYVAVSLNSYKLQMLLRRWPYLQSLPRAPDTSHSSPPRTLLPLPAVVLTCVTALANFLRHSLGASSYACCFFRWVSPRFWGNSYAAQLIRRENSIPVSSHIQRAGRGIFYVLSGALPPCPPPRPSGIPGPQVWQERVHFLPFRKQVMEMLSIGNAGAFL